MSANRDYVPRNDGQFDIWFKNIVTYVGVKAGGASPAWTHIPQAARTELTGAYTTWFTDYIPTTQPHTHGDIVKKDAARKAAEHFIRDFVQRYLARDPVTDAERADMNLHIRDTVVTESGDPTAFVKFAARPLGPALLELDFKVQGAEGKARPEHTTGAVFYWYVGDEPPAADADWDEFNKTDLATRTPYILHLRESDRGKKIHINARWQGSRGGKKGPWTETQETFIP